MTIYKRITLLCLTVMLAFVFGCAATSTREGTGEYIDDSAITAKVKSGLLGEPNLNSNDIQVGPSRALCSSPALSPPPLRSTPPLP